MKVLGMMLTFSTGVLYPAFAIAPRIWDISPTVDQQIGGIIMWVPAGFVIWINLAAHFFRWYRESARRDRGETNVVPLTRERVTLGAARSRPPRSRSCSPPAGSSAGQPTTLRASWSPWTRPTR